MFKSIVSKLSGDPAQKTMSKYQDMVAEVNALEAEYEKMSDDELRGVTLNFVTTCASRCKKSARVGKKRAIQCKQKTISINGGRWITASRRWRTNTSKPSTCC